MTRALACLFGCHAWRIILDTKPHLVHLHPLAGCLAVCTSCGTLWADADPRGYAPARPCFRPAPYRGGP